MKAHDALLGLVALLFGAAVALYARTFPALGGMPVGPGLFPSIVGGGLALCGVILIAQGLLSRRGGDRAPLVAWGPWARDPRAIARALAVPGALVLYILASEPLGFHLTAGLVAGGLMLAFGARLLVALPLAALSALGLHALFAAVLRVPLPRGALPWPW